LNQPLDPATYAELQQIQAELRAIQADAEQRYADITAKNTRDVVRGTTNTTTRTSCTPAEAAREAVRSTTRGRVATTLHGQPTNPAQTAQEAVRGTTQTNLEGDILQDGADVDLPDREKMARESHKTEKKPSFSQKVRNRYERLKDVKQRFTREHPQISAGVKGAARVASTASKANPYRAAIGEVLEFSIRNLDKKDIELAKALASKYGKDIRQWIHEAKETAENKGKSWFQKREAQEKSYFQKQNDLTNHKVDRLNHAIGREARKATAEKPYLIDEARFNHSPVSERKISNWKQQIDTLKTDLSLEHALSERAYQDGFFAKFQTHKAEKLAPSTRQQAANYLVGTPQERYDSLLYNAIHHLGDKHFDLSVNPRSGLDFDRFAASRLFQDGWEFKEVRQTLDNSPFRQVFAEHPQKGNFYQGKGYRDNSAFLKQYDDQVNQFHSHENFVIRNTIREFQEQEKGRILEGKVNPHDVGFQKKIEESREPKTNEVPVLKTSKESNHTREQIQDKQNFTTNYQSRLTHEPERER
jgi:hypothetical protein